MTQGEHKLVKGAVVVIAVIGAVGLFWAASGPVRPLEATARMEQLAANVERAKSIHPDTAREIARLIAQPWYDCNQVACSAQLQARNSAVRNRLNTVIATKTPLNDFPGARKQEPLPAVGTDAIATGSITGTKPK